MVKNSPRQLITTGFTMLCAVRIVRSCLDFWKKVLYEHNNRIYFKVLRSCSLTQEIFYVIQGGTSSWWNERQSEIKEIHCYF